MRTPKEASSSVVWRAAFCPSLDEYAARQRIAHYETLRVVDLDNPDAMIDLRSAFGRASVACGAAAIVLGPDLERFEALIYGPVTSLDLEFSIGLQADWNFNAPIWQNLLSGEPRPYVEFTHRSR